MGIIAKLKNLFSGTVTLPPQHFEDLVYGISVKRAKYKSGKKIDVPENHYACFVTNDKVCDILSCGIHNFDSETLPNTFKKNKMDHPNKKGELKKFFYSDIYYVNLARYIDVPWVMSRKFSLKTMQFGKVKGYFEGTISYRILDAETFLRLMLMDVAYIKNNYADGYILGLLSDTIREFITRTTMEFSTMLTDHYTLNTTLTDFVAPRLEECGIEIKGLVVTSINLPKKVQMRVNDYLAEEKESKVAMKEFDVLLPKGNEIEELNESVGESLKDFDTKSVSSAPDFAEENKGLGSDISLRRRGTVDQVKTDSNINMAKVDVEQALSQDTNLKKQCKYCDQMIGVEYKYCPFCGFKQE